MGRAQPLLAKFRASTQIRHKDSKGAILEEAAGIRRRKRQGTPPRGPLSAAAAPYDVISPGPEVGPEVGVPSEQKKGRERETKEEGRRGAAARFPVTRFGPASFAGKGRGRRRRQLISRLMHIFSFTLIWLRIWISMAQLQQGGPDEKEKTTALKDLLSSIDLDELMKKDEPPLEFPDTLEGFEYAFNEKGQLRHTKTGDPFIFNYCEDLHRWNQKRYEALGEIITKYVYELLEEKCHLKKVYVPTDAVESEPRSFIFMSEDAVSNPDKLMVLIHGSGVVRAGQWARRLIINEDLDSGTQIPYIKRAIEEGYGVIILNPNENYIEVEKTKAFMPLSPDSSDEPAEKRERKDKTQKDTKKRRDFYEKYRNPQKEKETVQLFIRENGSPEEHIIYVWDHFISQSAAENVFFVAHSYGGLAFVELMIQREAEVKNKVTAVALTDSVHNVWHQEAGKTIREWMRENCCNWVSSSEPLDTSVESMLPDCPRVSAGTERHELTSWKSCASIFRFFREASEARSSCSGKAGPARRSQRIRYEDL